MSTYTNNTGLVPQSSTLRWNREYKIWELTEVSLYFGPAAGCVGIVRPGLDANTANPGLIVDTCEVVEEAGWCTVTIVYVGLGGSGAGAGGLDIPESEDEDTGEVADAPIERHPKFAEIATEANGATFEKKAGGTNGKWTGWTKDSPYVGLESFVAPQRSFRRTWSDTVRPSGAEILSRLGKLDGNGNLMTKFSVRRRGAIYTIEQEFLAPGPRLKDYPIQLYYK